MNFPDGVPSIGSPTHFLLAFFTIFLLSIYGQENAVAQNLTPPNELSRDENALSRPPTLMAPPVAVVEKANNSQNEVSFNAWSRGRESVDIPDPIVTDEATWMRMEVSPDLPPRVASLGEDLIGAVAKQLPAAKKKKVPMPFDEFKIRVRDAVLSYPDVGIAETQLGYAQAGKSAAFAPLLPQVTGFSDTGRRKVGSDSYLGTPAINRDGTNYGVSVRQVLFDFGAAIFGFNAGKSRERAAQELVNSKRSEQALTSVSSLIDLERARALYLLAKENATSRLSIVKLVRERYELGGGAKPDIIRAESRYAEALANISTSENALKTAEAAYRQAFNAKAVGIVNGPNFEVPVEGLNKTADDYALNYPALLQLERLRDAASSDASAAYSKILPSLNFAYDNTQNGVSAPLAPSRSINALLQLRYSFYTGGADTAAKDQAQSKAKQAEYEFQSGLRQYEKAFSQNQEEVRNSDGLLAARRVAAISAISSMRAVREQFAFNKGSLLDLLTVQESLYNAGRDLVNADFDRQISRYRFIHLTAGLDKLFDLSEKQSEVKN